MDMKRLWTLLMVVGLMPLTYGQNLIAERFSSLVAREDVSHLRMTSKAFQMAQYLEAEVDDEETEAFFRFLTTMNALEILVQREVENPKVAYREALGKVPPSHQEVMELTEENGTFTFFLDEANGRVYEAVLIGHGPEECMVLSLTGDMALADLVKYLPQVQGEELRYMGPLATHGQLKLYPNPARAGNYLAVEVPENLIGGTAIWYSLDGRMLQQAPVSDRLDKLSTHGLAAGVYVLTIKNGNVSVKRRVVLE